MGTVGTGSELDMTRDSREAQLTDASAAFVRNEMQKRHDAMVNVCEEALASGARMAKSLESALRDLETARAELQDVRAEGGRREALVPNLVV